MGYLREPSYCSTWERRWLLEILDYGLAVAVQSLSESDSLWPQGLQRARPPCPSPSLGVCSDSCPSRQRLPQLKMFRIIWELALSFLWFGEPVESGRGGGKKDKAGSRQKVSGMNQNASHGGSQGGGTRELDQMETDSRARRRPSVQHEDTTSFPFASLPGGESSSSIQSFFNTSKQITI